MVFGDAVMRQKLPRDTYKSLKKTIENGKELDISLANVVANAMKDWALEKGATHFTHWFQPMTGITAEKHDSFITPVDGGVIMEFSGKELIKGEPDASSFPSGGLRATFEARGYTAWDPTSYAFIKDDTLCIPTAFCSYGGEALDKKTPLLRSMEAVSRQAVRVLKLFGVETKKVISTVGPEQEYFLVDKKLYDRRPDLMLTGHTLFMKELDEELWKLGILAKTEHNEAAPAQHELAPIFTTTNIATDHNQLTMEIMKKVAARHGLVCLLHEKPFAGVNGSGKHNNWSLSTAEGANLLEPGETPRDNAQFLFFLAAVIAAVDDHQDLLRVSVASASNDHRLGGFEAPPAIISMFLGDELTEILASVVYETDYDRQEKCYMEIGADVLPKFPKDTTDRNRTSPFAFTGNKFEFRSLGSSNSVSGPNITLNTIVADELEKMADRLEALISDGGDFNHSVAAVIRDTINAHKRIIYNGDGYSEDWVREAERRGLLNLRTTPDALPYFTSERNIEMYGRHHVFTPTEMRSRNEIHYEIYCKIENIDALTMLDMTRREVVPAVMKYIGDVSGSAVSAASLGVDVSAQKELLEKLSAGLKAVSAAVERLDETTRTARAIGEYSEMSFYIRDEMAPAMSALRKAVDSLETIVGKEYWPWPSYSELLYNI